MQMGRTKGVELRKIVLVAEKKEEAKAQETELTKWLHQNGVLHLFQLDHTHLKANNLDAKLKSATDLIPVDTMSLERISAKLGPVQVKRSMFVRKRGGKLVHDFLTKNGLANLTDVFPYQEAVVRIILGEEWQRQALKPRDLLS